MNRIQTLLSLAKEELYAAEILWENTLYRACISRAYYSLNYERREAKGYSRVLF